MFTFSFSSILSALTSLVLNRFGAGAKEGCELLVGKCMEVNVDVVKTVVKAAF